MAKLRDPLKETNPALPSRKEVLQAAREAEGTQSSAELLGARPRPSKPTETSSLTPVTSHAPKTTEERAKEDFRVFLTIVWRHLLRCDPHPIQLDMAYWLQHGPDRAIIMANRGFSKSWITGAYAVWRLWRDPTEMVAIVSASQKRSIATTQWALNLILTLPMLREMIPQPHQRQSSQNFDVGTCKLPGQSANFSAYGIGGQMTGFRATLIIPDDVETDKNSDTVVMREKIIEAVKEFESVITPGGQIKYLGTPHSLESLYLFLLRLHEKDGTPVYVCRIWCALYPTEEQIRGYQGRLAPYILHQIATKGPSIVGHSTMPTRFSDADLEKRRAAIGNSEFILQFMLDLSGLAVDKYPLKLSDLLVANLDPERGPENMAWGPNRENIIRDLPNHRDGDYFHHPIEVSTSTQPYTRKVAFIDPSGRGKDETAMAIAAELYGRVFWLHSAAWLDGYAPATLKAIAAACVRFGVHELRIEAEYGDGMFAQLLHPYVTKAWDEENKRRHIAHGRNAVEGGTAILEVKSGKAQKEKRILSILEPVTQQHRLVVSRTVLDWDRQSVNAYEGEEARHKYQWSYQFVNLTAERGCLAHDDRLDALAGAVAAFADVLGVDPLGMVERAREDDQEAELRRLLGLDADTFEWGAEKQDTRVFAARITYR